MKIYSVIENRVELSILLIYLNDLLYSKKIDLDKSIYEDKRPEWNSEHQRSFIENLFKFPELVNTKIVIISNINHEFYLVDGHNRVYSFLKFLNNEFAVTVDGIELIYSELKKIKDIGKIIIPIKYITYNELNIEKEAIKIFNILNSF